MSLNKNSSLEILWRNPQQYSGTTADTHTTGVTELQLPISIATDSTGRPVSSTHDPHLLGDPLVDALCLGEQFVERHSVQKSLFAQLAQLVELLVPGGWVGGDGSQYNRGRGGGGGLRKLINRRRHSTHRGTVADGN